MMGVKMIKVLEQRENEAWSMFVDRCHNYLDKCHNCSMFFNRQLGQAVIHATKDSWYFGL